MSRTTSGFAQWRPDPFRRFELRRFFLDQPTSLVMNGSLETYDAVGPLLMSDQRLSASSSLASGQAHESSGAVAIGNDPIAEQVQEETPPQYVPVALAEGEPAQPGGKNRHRQRRKPRDSSDLPPDLIEGIRRRLRAG